MLSGVSRMDVGGGEGDMSDSRLLVTQSDVDRLFRQRIKQCPPFLSPLDFWGVHQGDPPSAS